MISFAQIISLPIHAPNNTVIHNYVQDSKFGFLIQRINLIYYGIVNWQQYLVHTHH